MREAYEKYVHPDFFHHHAYFKGDRESLLAEMEKNAKQFPSKTYETQPCMAKWSVIHIFRFQDGKIIEEWEASQEALKDSPNDNED